MTKNYVSCSYCENCLSISLQKLETGTKASNKTTEERLDFQG